ncbi:integral membrane protein DUF106-domain-containing protein [Polychytrium aggregatum]|uniref:integral membrane protein DUF106-domain-containing protein n=1 Tax=Polychytrium aggregatum TaxID=110093 RepID=UPI0022FDDD74|nr:integral membrane protein DUF106-domain-containing protein [Polychytrium aggregatum]KAI9205538.1 integral membrane protein DUF106-domain-containing protein [Polychytrium aggregatum]
MAGFDSEAMYLDPAIRDWVLFPIMIVMIMVGVLRHHATQLLNSPPKTTWKAVRESSALARSRIIRAQSRFIPASGFKARKEYLSSSFEKGAYLKNPDPNAAAANPMQDPQGMEAMADMMKKNMAMFIPQTLIMSWITFFFSGFVLTKLPFPLTVRFKAMLQRGIETSDMDVSWVSSLSWYFLNLFGLKSIYVLILGAGNEADGSRDMQQMQMMGATQQPMQQPNEVANMFKSEKEFLNLATHEWAYDDVEDRVLGLYGKAQTKTLSAKGKKSQ